MNVNCWAVYKSTCALASSPTYYQNIQLYKSSRQDSSDYNMDLRQILNNPERILPYPRPWQNRHHPSHPSHPRHSMFSNINLPGLHRDPHPHRGYFNSERPYRPANWGATRGMSRYHTGERRFDRGSISRSRMTDVLEPHLPNGFWIGRLIRRGLGAPGEQLAPSWRWWRQGRSNSWGVCCIKFGTFGAWRMISRG